MFEKSLKIWLANDLIFRLTKRGREHKKAINFIHANTNSIIRTRRKKLCSLENATGTKNDDDADYIGRLRINKVKKFFDFGYN